MDHAASLLPAQGLSEAQIKTFLHAVLAGLDRAHLKSRFFWRLHSLDSYALESPFRVRIVAVPSAATDAGLSAQALLKRQADDVWAVGVLCLALACGSRAGVDGVFGQHLRGGDLTALTPTMPTLECELLDLVARLRGDTKTSTRAQLPHISSHFANILIRMVQADWSRRPSAKALLDGSHPFWTRGPKMQPLPSTLLPVPRPFRRTSIDPSTIRTEPRDDAALWCRLREAESSFGHLAPTRTRDHLRMLPSSSSSSLFGANTPDKKCQEQPSSTRRTPLQDVSNAAQGHLSVESSIRQNNIGSPVWRDDTTLFNTSQVLASRASDKASRHGKALSRLSRYVETSHKAGMAKLVSADAEPPAQSEFHLQQEKERRTHSKVRPPTDKHTSPSGPLRVSSKQTEAQAESDLSTWSGSDCASEDGGERTRVSRTPSVHNARLGPSPSRQSSNSPRTVPLQSTPPRRQSTNRVPVVSDKAKNGSKASPTAAQKKLVRRALGSPEMNAPWSTRSSPASGTKPRTSISTNAVDLDAQDDNNDHGHLTPLRGMRLARAALSGAPPSTLSPISSRSPADAEATTSTLDLRGLEGIRQRTRYGKVYVLPHPEVSHDRGNSRPVTTRTVLIALRGEARGVTIQAETKSYPAINGGTRPAAPVTISVGVLRSQQHLDADVVSDPVQAWHSWTLKPDLTLEQVGDAPGGPPEWVLRVYAHLCRWAQRRRQDLLQRVQA